MTADRAIDLYVEKYGGFPYFMFMGASDETIIETVQKALETGEEIAVDHVDGDR